MLHISQSSRNGARQNGILLSKARTHTRTGVIPCTIHSLPLPQRLSKHISRTLSPSHPRVYGRYASYDERCARTGTRWLSLASQTLTIRGLSGGLLSVFLWSQESRYGKGLIKRLFSGKLFYQFSERCSGRYDCINGWIKDHMHRVWKVGHRDDAACCTPAVPSASCPMKRVKRCVRFFKLRNFSIP